MYILNKVLIAYIYSKLLVDVINKQPSKDFLNVIYVSC